MTSEPPTAEAVCAHTGCNMPRSHRRHRMGPAVPAMFDHVFVEPRAATSVDPVAAGREALNRIIADEWGWDENDEGNAFPREPKHDCIIARGGPTCRTCEDYAVVLEGWLALAAITSSREPEADAVAAAVELVLLRAAEGHDHELETALDDLIAAASARTTGEERLRAALRAMQLTDDSGNWCHGCDELVLVCTCPYGVARALAREQKVE